MEEKIFEIEYKGRIDFEDIEEIRDRLHKNGFSFVEKVFQEDIYFDTARERFKKGDEALRIRKEGEKAYLTYKNKRIGKGLKAREEIEFPFSPSYVSQLSSILNKLEIYEVAILKKEREFYKKKDIVFSLDYIEGLGYFVEIEKKSSDIEKAWEEINQIKAIILPKTVKDIEKTYLELYLEECKKQR
jgi:adenylate cyclase class 2